MLFPTPRPGIRLIIIAASLCAVSFFAFVLFFDAGAVYSPLRQTPPSSHEPHKLDQRKHPIDDLILESGKALHSLLAKESFDLSAATKAYRERRGRLPPPGFDQWFRYAQENDAVIVEDFFDQIYHDLNPFWGIEAKILRRQAKGHDFSVSVRNHTAILKTDEKNRPWPEHWKDMVGAIAEYLPDFDMPFNTMDEPRIIVSWEDINDLMEKERSSRKIPPLSDVVSEYSGLGDVDVGEIETFPPEWIKGGASAWDFTRPGCPPGSVSREEETLKNYEGRPILPKGFPKYSYKGYVQNWTLATDPCVIPNIQGMHGTFIEPISRSTSKTLFPMFGGSKLPINNEILIPHAIYWSDWDWYTGGDTHGIPWDKKNDVVIWRGAASGGRNKKSNWTRFQRHRFVAMVNGTTVQLAENSPEGAPNFEVISYDKYQLEATKHTDLGEWLSSFTDVAFYDLQCFPNEHGLHCPYTDPYFEVVEKIPMAEQYDNKYLPDIDGNSYSGRYWGFIRSTSLPIKATIYKEWHDARLIPWQHFVPMDNSFVDIYGILDYFIGSGEGGGHDDVAKDIAIGGKKWAEKVLRKEDMLIYLYRLLLEFTRICDDKRDVLGYFEDA